MAILNRNEIGWHCQCDHCGTIFDSSRSTAAFCSSKCRVAHHREIKALEMRLIDFQIEAARLVYEMKNGKFGRDTTQAALERVALTINRWNSDPNPGVKELAIHGHNPFMFDKDFSVTTAE